ncbi:MAG TPA: type II toxin-antitoxin system VapC family toxin [Chloroflexi bacterium]|nr:type II toxin-antitoxin system VapC family toxin [Chloroflexota bacterium]
MIVADTHVIIWDALKPDLLSQPARDAITRANKGDGIIFCEISLWEIAMLVQKKRLQTDATYQSLIKLILQSNNYILQGITPQIAELSTLFPPTVNKDPADRLIAATAIAENAILVTADRNLRQAESVDTLW